MAKPFQVTLSKFTQMTKGSKELKYIPIDEYVIGELINVYDDYIKMSFKELVQSGADESVSVITLNNIERYGKAYGTFGFLKYKGRWKIAYWHKRTMGANSIKTIKAIDVISKIPPNMCDCVNKTAEGSQYIAKKCFFYFKNKGNRSKVIDEFISCLNEQNYCSYKQTTDKIYKLERERVSVFDMMNEMYFPGEEQNKKIAKLKAECQ